MKILGFKVCSKKVFELLCVFTMLAFHNFINFKEILLAEKWAKLHHLPFPKIDRTVYEKNGMKECYVFKDDEDENAPTIIHFVLCNVKFRDYVKPGE